MIDSGVLERARALDLRQIFAFSPKARHNGRYSSDVCQWHDDTNPSLLVFADGYKCQACGIHGDTIDYVMHSRSIGFVDALRLLNGGEVIMENRQAFLKVERVDPPVALSEDVLEPYREIRQVDIDAVASLSGLALDTARRFRILVAGVGLFVVPTWDRGDLVDVQLYDPLQISGVKWRPLWAGRGKHLYNAEAILSGDMVVVVEGPKDCWFADQIGIVAVGVGGAEVFKAEYVDALAEADEVFVCGDFDRAGKRLNALVCAKMLNARPVSWSFLGRPVKRGYDLADFVAEGGTREQFDVLLEAGTRYGGTRPLLLRHSDI